MAIQAEMYPENMGLMQHNYGGARVGGSQDWMPAVEHGCGVGVGGGGCFGGLNQILPQKNQQQQLFVQQQQQQQLYMLQQQNLQLLQQKKNHSSPGFVFSATSKSTAKINDFNNTTNNNNSSCCNSTNFISSLDAQFQKQNQEIDTYLTLQNERLKLALQQQRKQQLASLLRKLESNARVLLGQKDEELAKATKRRLELEEFMTKMEAENQAWRNLALEKEAAALSLNNTLQQLKERSQFSHHNDAEAAEDAESCCDDFSNRGGGGGGDEEEEEEDDGSRGKKRMKMACRACNSGNLCVLFLPCRHLSSCKACEAFLDRCPVCQSEKKGIIEALLS